MDWNTFKKSLNSPKLALLCLSVVFLLIGKVATQATTTAEVITQLEQLSNKNRQSRLSAVKTLKKIGSTAIPVLIEALNDPDINIRKNAAFALGSMGAEAIEAVPALLAALKDADQSLRMDVAVALRHIGPTSTEVLEFAIADLTNTLTDENPQVRQGAAFGLGILSQEAASAVPHLIATLKDSDEEVQIAAAIALKRIGQAAVPALTAALNDEQMSVRAKAAFALGKINAEAVPSVTEALENSAQQIHLKKRSSGSVHAQANRPNPTPTTRPTPGGNRPTTGPAPGGNRPIPRPNGYRG